jgi:antitoxin component YwqK of YwqJK toxin-antitoxin module
MIESNYRNNLLDGVFIQYGTDGKIIRKDLYKEDKLINSMPIE